MKKRFINKKRRKNSFIKRLFFFVLFILLLVLSFSIFSRSSISINDERLVKLLLYPNEFNFSTGVIETIKRTFNSPFSLLDGNYFEKVEIPVINDIPKNNDGPLIYIYNSHQGEEYKHSNFAEFSIRPTVMFASFALQDIFNENKYETIVEEESIKEILNNNGWKYSYSYAASRVLMEEAFKKNSSLKYFIDVHRDSLDYDRTTIQIGDKTFARTIFLIGMENSNYQDNLSFTEEINNLMNERYPGLSKGIYKKSGPLVNGVYNQDFSKYTILIEIGGYENTPSEVLNSVLAFSECFMEVINNYEKG